MFNKILIPLEGSPQSAVALPLARAMLGTGVVELVLARVVAEPTSLPVESSDEAYEAQAYLNWVANELRSAPIVAQTRVIFGSPGEQIVNTIGAVGADLVVMAIHRRDEVGRPLFGTVAEHVMVHSPVPVLVVRPGGKRVTRIRTLLVTLDGTRGGRLGLEVAARLAAQHDARLELVTVIKGPPGYLKHPAPGVDIDNTPGWESARQEAAEALERTAQRLRRKGIQTTTRALVGDASQAIVSAAEQIGADLVIMSTHGPVQTARGLLGSVAASVVCGAGRPVLLVRRSVRRATSARGATSFDPIRAVRRRNADLASSVAIT